MANKRKIYSERTKSSDLKKGDFVYAKKEFGIVVEKGKTFLHKHKFVKIKWTSEEGFKYKIKYLLEDNKVVEKIFANSEDSA